MPPELAGEVLAALVRHVAERVRIDGATVSPACRALLTELHEADRREREHMADDGHDHDGPATIDVAGLVMVAQLAETSGYSCRTLRRWAASGRITARRVGRQWLVDPESLKGRHGNEGLPGEAP